MPPGGHSRILGSIAAIRRRALFDAGQQRGDHPHQATSWRQRSAMNGHMKLEGKLARNHLKGALGDAIHALLVQHGHNLRLILRHLARFLARCSSCSLPPEPTNPAFQAPWRRLIRPPCAELPGSACALAFFPHVAVAAWARSGQNQAFRADAELVRALPPLRVRSAAARLRRLRHRDRLGDPGAARALRNKPAKGLHEAGHAAISDR